MNTTWKKQVDQQQQQQLQQRATPPRNGLSRNTLGSRVPKYRA